MARANGITRQEILTSIKCSGTMTAEELARELGISQVAVRQHLSSLEAESLIAISVERRGLGRPSHRYRLTAEGDETFPRRYDLLAIQLLDELEEWQGSEVAQALFARRRERFQRAAQPRLQNKSLRAQVEEIARLQTEAGYMAEVCEDAPGVFRLVEHNCAICAVARCHPDVCCASEMQLYQDLLGDVSIVRERYILNGDPTCTFRIQATPIQAAPDEGVAP